MAQFLFILNRPPYGNEHWFNGLRLADSLARKKGNEVKVFLIGDAAVCAKSDQKVPKGVLQPGTDAASDSSPSGTDRRVRLVLDARGITDAEIAEGCHRSSMEELTSWTVWADKVLVF